MVDAYQQADAYHDQAIVRVSYKIEGQTFDDTAPLAVIFERPNKLRLEAYRATVVSDGEMINARIEDESTGNIDNQIVSRPAPPKLHLQDIYGDTLLSQVIGSGLARFPVQLELLLDENPLASARGEESTRAVQPPAPVEGELCDRVTVSSAEGNYTFWIDQQSKLLRRLEYPTGHMQPETEVEHDVSGLKLVVDFRKAAFAAATEGDRFAIDTPDDAQQVRYFVPPPQPLPTTLFGEQPGEFAFKTLAGDPVSSATLNGKVAVLLWYNNHPAGQASATALNEVATTLADDDRIAFYGICTEPSTTSDLQIENLMRLWRVELPIARDLSAIGRDVFQVPVWPTLVVLDAKGRVQLFEAGHIEPVYEALPKVLKEIADGENLAKHIVAAYQSELDQYARDLATASGSSESTLVEIPTAEIAPRSDPHSHALEEVWATTEIDAPGNLLVVTGDEETNDRLLVLSANREVVELGLDGKVIARHALPLGDSGVQHLATTLDNDGKRVYLAWSNLGPHAQLFDADWKPLGAYPKLDQKHDGIRDCLLADLDGDGTPAAYVAFWGAAGVHEVSLTGERKWTNRAATGPMSLAAGLPNAAGQQRLLITTSAGNLLPLNPYGREEPPQTIGSYAVHELVRAANTDMLTPLCALSLTAEGAAKAIAVDSDFVERWSYELPTGAHRNALRPVVAGKVLPGSEGDWIFAGADGSLHAIAADGSASDYFYFGQELTGLTAGRGMMLVASDNGVTALRFTAK